MNKRASEGLRRITPALFVLFLLLESRAFGYINKNEVFENLVPGMLYTGIIPVAPEDSTTYKTFVIQVPEDTFAIRLSLEGSRVDLDLYLLHGKEIENYSDVDYEGSSDEWNEELFISRFSDPHLENGIYYVDVVYQLPEPPVADGVILTEIPFSLRYEVISASSSREILPGHPVSLTLDPKKGMFEVVKVTIPEGTDSFRIDLFNTTGDTDFWISRDKPAVKRDQALYIADSLLARETFVLTPGSVRGAGPGTYFISVFDQMIEEAKFDVSIIVSLGTEAPAMLMDIVPFPYPRDRFEEALFATVEVIGNTGKGSGCLVSQQGHLLTNYHVIEGYDGNPAPHIAVGVHTSFALPSREMFSASVIAYDIERDLALLKIDRGLYGQALPFQYKFPYFRLGRGSELSIGQPLGLIGFPGIGGTGSRVSLTYTQGVVSGFEQAGVVLFIKTDGIIHDGSSGGAAVNSYSELVGIPTVVVGQGSGQIGYVTSVETIPKEWLDFFIPKR